MERLARKADAVAGSKQIPLGRWGTVREIADATVYLFSEAAGYVNGATLVGESKLPLLFLFMMISRPEGGSGSFSFDFFLVPRAEAPF